MDNLIIILIAILLLANLAILYFYFKNHSILQTEIEQNIYEKMDNI